jgi:hypothetical protein
MSSIDGEFAIQSRAVPRVRKELMLLLSIVVQTHWEISPANPAWIQTGQGE